MTVKTRQQKLKDIIPKDMTTDELLKKLYYNPTIGLIGKDKFYQKVKIIKPDITMNEIDTFYDKQAINQVMARNIKTKVFSSMYAFYPTNIYEIDYIVYNRYTMNHYQYIFGCIDVYSRYAQAVATTNMRNETTIKALEKIFKVMGKPEILKGDRQFFNKEFIKYCDENNIKYEFTTSNEIYKNPIIERFNGTLARNINKYRVSSGNKKWYSYLSDIVDNYNLTYHKTIKDAPYNIMFQDKNNNQEIVILPSTFEIGDQVRKVIKKKVFDKGDMITHSPDVYIIEEIKGNKFKISDGRNHFYKPYEIKKANQVEFDDNVIIPEPVLYKTILKPRKRIDVDKGNIVTSTRKRETMDHKKVKNWKLETAQK